MVLSIRSGIRRAGYLSVAECKTCVGALPHSCLTACKAHVLGPCGSSSLFGTRAASFASSTWSSSSWPGVFKVGGRREGRLPGFRRRLGSM